MISKPLGFWDTVVFSDESQFAQFSDSSRVLVWRLPSQEFSLRHLQPTVKFGGFSVMIWGAIRTTGCSELVVCDVNANAEKYISILDQGLLSAFHSGKLRRRSTLFMQDGAPCHTAKKTKDWLAKERIKCLLQHIQGVSTRDLYYRQGSDTYAPTTYNPKDKMEVYHFYMLEIYLLCPPLKAVL